MKPWDWAKQEDGSGTAGFSIVELIIAIAVGGLLVLATNNIINTYLHTGQKSRNLLLANSYVEGKVEALRNQGFNALNVGDSDITSELPSALPNPKSASLDITNPSPGIKQIDITLSFYDQGTTRSYSYTTYIGELGVGQ
ncbi:MAG TPA: prepilin-type N-terminal cleavage/methylation domain-containing protein [Candidatus Saccharimonadales bacterium]|nr:prepilin-type N-terminal cleavage/methylation domain-containing protein [Candidatus Saccharimonadales bacterium]